MYLHRHIVYPRLFCYLHNPHPSPPSTASISIFCTRAHRISLATTTATKWPILYSNGKKAFCITFTSLKCKPKDIYIFYSSLRIESIRSHPPHQPPKNPSTTYTHSFAVAHIYMLYECALARCRCSAHTADIFMRWHMRRRCRRLPRNKASRLSAASRAEGVAPPRRRAPHHVAWQRRLWELCAVCEQRTICAENHLLLVGKQFEMNVWHGCGGGCCRRFWCT